MATVTSDSPQQLRSHLALLWLELVLDPWSCAAAVSEELSRPPEPFRPVPAAELGWKKYLPVRQMTAEEYEAYLQKKAKREEHRYDINAACGHVNEVRATKPSGGATHSHPAGHSMPDCGRLTSSVLRVMSNLHGCIRSHS